MSFLPFVTKTLLRNDFVASNKIASSIVLLILENLYTLLEVSATQLDLKLCVNCNITNMNDLRYSNLYQTLNFYPSTSY